MNEYYSKLENSKNKDDLDYLKFFFEKYSHFNYFEYKKWNPSINELNFIDTIKHYDNNYLNEHIVLSFDIFYKKYPNFDILFYKLINKDLNYLNNIDILLHYHNSENKENIISSILEYKNKYNIDFTFLKKFYKNFMNKNDVEIIIIINENINNYIISEKDFDNKFPNFNIYFYKIFNPEILFNDDIKYKSNWYHNDNKLNDITSINDYIKCNPEFNLSLFKIIYNINSDSDITEDMIYQLYKNKDKLIYSTDTFYKYIIDFNFIDFIKTYNVVKKFSKIEIINFYISNINKIKNIYSLQYFKLKYPEFNFDIFQKMNPNIIKNFNKNYQNNITLILNGYHLLNDKENYVISIKDFYTKYKKFDIHLYKEILYYRNNISFKTDNEYIYYWYNNDKNKYYTDYLNDFYKLYSDFNINIYKCFNKNILYKNYNEIILLYDFYNKIKNNNINLSKIIYSKKTFYLYYKKFNINYYILLNNLQNYSEEEVIIHFYTIGLKLNLKYMNNNENNNNENNNENNNNDNNNNYDDIFDLNIYKKLNKDIDKLSDKELVNHYLHFAKIEDRIYSKYSFYQKYPEFNSNNYMKNTRINFLKEDEKIIYYMTKGIYDYLHNINKDIIGRNIVNNIYEVLIDLTNKYPKNRLTKGISLIIRAKNEENNIKDCIESVVDLVDEIIFVDNASTDDTYNLVSNYLYPT